MDEKMRRVRQEIEDRAKGLAIEALALAKLADDNGVKSYISVSAGKSGSGKLTATATCCPATVAARADLTTFVTFDGGLTWED
ncbi:MAG TPA: hypothetical protein K8V16_07645 [Rubneribacter badeniensis]|uniref:Uncharacterized protein n=1 Tax=Rubneribacter badeniensis TaxID=2070688 RepID=A0A9D2VLK8_9ACTN|nr:hypothetical protein [Rubneribacter badeniensis]